MNHKSYVKPRGWPPHSERLVTIVHEVGHFLIGLSTGRENLEIRFTDGEGICLYKPWKLDTFDNYQVQQGLWVDVAGFVAEHLYRRRIVKARGPIWKISNAIRRGGFQYVDESEDEVDVTDYDLHPFGIATKGDFDAAWEKASNLAERKSIAQLAYLRHKGHAQAVYSGQETRKVLAELVCSEREVEQVLIKKWNLVREIAKRIIESKSQRITIRQLRRLIPRLDSCSTKITESLRSSYRIRETKFWARWTPRSSLAATVCSQPRAARAPAPSLPAPPCMSRTRSTPVAH